MLESSDVVELILNALMNTVSIPIRIYRWLGVAFLIITYLMSAILGKRNRHAINKAYSKALLRVLGIQVQVIGRFTENSCVLVSNHCSWVDPFLVTSLANVAFVTSTDTQKDPLLGPITSVAGCHFVSRKPWSLPQEIAAMEKTLANQVHLAFYPEATSGDGSTLLPFRPTFFDLSVRSQIPVQPAVLRWNSDIVPYYGDMTFIPHIARIIATKGIRATYQLLEPISPSEYADRKALAQACEESIQSSFLQKNA